MSMSEENSIKLEKVIDVKSKKKSCIITGTGPSSR